MTDKVVWYMDFWHAIWFEVAVTVAGVCSAIQLYFILRAEKRRRLKDG